MGDSAVASGSDKPSGDRLWEDNWDDDDFEDEFMMQLRYAASLSYIFFSLLPS